MWLSWSHHHRRPHRPRRHHRVVWISHSRWVARCASLSGDSRCGGPERPDQLADGGFSNVALLDGV